MAGGLGRSLKNDQNSLVKLLKLRVNLERLKDVLCALRTDLVVLEPVSAGEIRVSAAIDSRESGVRRRTRASGGPSSS